MITGKQILLVATALAAVTGGGITTIAKTKSLSKFTQVKVTKHTVTGKTTKNVTVRLLSAQGKQLAKRQANRSGKFKFTLKKQNLTQLKFKLTATKPGYQSQTFKHKTTTPQKPTQVADTAVPTKPIKPVTPAGETMGSDNQTLGSRVPVSTAAIKAKRAELAAAKANCQRIRIELQPVFDEYNAYNREIRNTQIKLTETNKSLAAAQDRGDIATANGLQTEVNRLRQDLHRLGEERLKTSFKMTPLDDANSLASYLAGELAQMDPSYTLESF